MSQLGLILQESLRTEREPPRTIHGLLTEQMDGVDRRQRRRRRTLKERLGFNRIGCCGASWVFRHSTVTVRHEEEALELEHEEETNASQDPNPIGPPECLGPGPSSSGMNLAAALAAERQFRESHQETGHVGPSVEDRSTVPGTPWRMSLMRLLEETDGGDAEVETVGNDSMCCVCMVKKKGAAFIPCGHTFCRVCSRELWLNRGTCPLCNRSILEILDIF